MTSSAERPARMSPRRLRLAAAMLAGALLAASLALAVVALRSPARPATLEGRVRAVASTLRCPVCQSLSVADSPSSLARQMRAEIASDLRAGRTPDQIRATFVKSYGDWILLSPPRHGLDLVLWIAPAALLLAGVAAAGVAVRRWTLGGGGWGARTNAEEPAGPDLSAVDRRLLDRALAHAEAEDPE